MVLTNMKQAKKPTVPVNTANPKDNEHLNQKHDTTDVIRHLSFIVIVCAIGEEIERARTAGEERPPPQ